MRYFHAVIALILGALAYLAFIGSKTALVVLAVAGAIVFLGAWANWIFDHVPEA